MKHLLSQALTLLAGLPLIGMAVAKTAAGVMQGFGVPTVNSRREGVTANVGATTIRVPAGTATFGPISNGAVRVKSATIGTNATFIVTSITGTDGTTTVNLYGGDAAASAAGVGIDRLISFVSDLALTSISVVVTVATANSTVDVEVFGNS